MKGISEKDFFYLLKEKSKYIPFVDYLLIFQPLNILILSNKIATDFILRVPASQSQKQIVPSAPVEDRYLFEPLHNGENCKAITGETVFTSTKTVQITKLALQTKLIETNSNQKHKMNQIHDCYYITSPYNS